MKVWEFTKALKSKQVPRAMMFCGVTPYLIDYYIKKLSLLYAPNDQALKLYFTQYNFNEAKMYLTQNSLFGGSNLLIIKSEKKIPKQELDALIKLVEKSLTNFFIYAYYGLDYSAVNRSFNSKTKSSNSVRFFEPKFNDALPLLREESQRLQLHIDNLVLQHLFNSQNENIALSINELSKLSILNRPIEIKDINALVYSLAEVRLDDIIANLLEKKAFLKDFSKLLQSGENAVQIITEISNFLVGLLKFLIHMKLNGHVSSQAVLGFQLPLEIEKQRINLARKFTLQIYKKMLQLLLDCEFNLKYTTIENKESLLIATILKLESIIK